MRPRIFSLGIGASIWMLGAALADNSGDSGPQLPVGQTFKNFEFPLYQDGKLKYQLNASQATGITQNRAETTDLVIKIYDNDIVTTTITSPKADLYVKEEKLRTKYTVRIVRADQEATAQTCDFDLVNKKYLLRTNVRVLLKNFDPTATPAANAPASTPATAGSTTPISPPRPLRSDDDSLPGTPGSYASTNSAPLPPTSTDTK